MQCKWYLQLITFIVDYPKISKFVKATDFQKQLANYSWFSRQFLKIERGPGHCVNARKHCGLAEAKACLYERAVPAELAELYYIYAVTETALLCSGSS